MTSKKLDFLPFFGKMWASARSNRPVVVRAVQAARDDHFPCYLEKIGFYFPFPSALFIQPFILKINCVAEADG
jgi:hypothetical protein